MIVLRLLRDAQINQWGSQMNYTQFDNEGQIQFLYSAAFLSM